MAQTAHEGAMERKTAPWQVMRALLGLCKRQF